MTLNEQAWELLLPDEQMSLNLQYGHDKSSWEAGELLGKVHYKYLEIKYRAEQFLKIFTIHYKMYGTLFPQEMVERLSIPVMRYLHLTIEKRENPKKIYSENPEITKKNVEQELSTFIRENSESDSLIILNFVNLIKEFDRWNNFRIIPKDVQEPSAFKRRNKNLDKKRIRVITSINPLSLDLIQKICVSKRDTGIWCVLLTPGELPSVFSVKPKEAFRLTEVGIYLWPSKQLAIRYAELVKSYVDKGKKNCSDGLNFWPEYREVIIKATNYYEIQKIYPSRRYLEMAVGRLKFYNHKN